LLCMAPDCRNYATSRASCFALAIILRPQRISTLGYGAGATQEQWTAAIRMWQKLGYTVKALAFSAR
jgi:hypothetical protein